jgi:4-alpha-glucanotransferase
VAPQERKAGILLHPTSLPGSPGIGELGSRALAFVDFMRRAGQRLWQVLPLGPTGPDGSPYSSASAFAGNPLLISTERLVEEKLLEHLPRGRSSGPVDYPALIPSRRNLLREAHGRWKPGEGFERFREENAGWLEDYALYEALKEARGGKPWHRWEPALRRREKDALRRARRELAGDVCFHEFVQYLFFAHWSRVKSAANAAGVEVVGDLPIFVSHDSADVWANQELFLLDRSGHPTVVAGVPPDYFSETGQLWGNPLYDWERMRQDGYRWWAERMRQALTLYDAVRVDHFRGFEASWEVPADEKTAKNGRWSPGPGKELFRKLAEELGDLPIIAEDLGEITPEVEELRDSLGLPGMKVLQFAFSSDAANPHLPHNHGGNWVVYTGTHDNDTTLGWWESASPAERSFARRYLGREFVSVWDFIRLAYASPASRTVVPVQDVLSLGAEARMNHPGIPEGNWRWRVSPDALSPQLAERLRALAETYGR